MSGPDDNVTHLAGHDEPEFDAGAHALGILDRLQPDLKNALESGQTQFGDDKRLLVDCRAIVELIGVVDFHDEYDSLSIHTIHDAAYLVSRMLSVAVGDYVKPGGGEGDTED